MVKTLLAFKAGGHTFMLTYPKGQPEGADAALESWRDNPEVPLTNEDYEALVQKLTYMATVKQLFGHSGGMF
jgi:hypothetical protein